MMLCDDSGIKYELPPCYQWSCHGRSTHLGNKNLENSCKWIQIQTIATTLKSIRNFKNWFWIKRWLHENKMKSRIVFVGRYEMILSFL